MKALRVDIRSSRELYLLKEVGKDPFVWEYLNYEDKLLLYYSTVRIDDVLWEPQLRTFEKEMAEDRAGKIRQLARRLISPLKETAEKAGIKAR